MPPPSHVLEAICSRSVTPLDQSARVEASALRFALRSPPQDVEERAVGPCAMQAGGYRAKASARARAGQDRGCTPPPGCKRVRGVVAAAGRGERRSSALARHGDPEHDAAHRVSGVRHRRSGRRAPTTMLRAPGLTRAGRALSKATAGGDFRPPLRASAWARAWRQRPRRYPRTR